MEKSGLMQTAASKEDLRKKLVVLTRDGRRDAELVERVAQRAAIVFTEVFDEIGVDLFRALRAFEDAIDRRPLVGRLLESDKPMTVRRKAARGDETKQRG
jgi:hypothetical protein